jgi:hypothetical protein
MDKKIELLVVIVKELLVAHATNVRCSGGCRTTYIDVIK